MLDLNTSDAQLLMQYLILLAHFPFSRSRFKPLPSLDRIKASGKKESIIGVIFAN